jgi:hypothetical protein
MTTMCARRCADAVVLGSLACVLRIVSGPDAPVHLTVDATPLGPPVAGSCLIVVGVPVRPPFARGRVARLPLLVRLVHASGPQRSHRISRSEATRDLLCLVADRLPRRRLHAVVSESCAARALRGLRDNVTVTVAIADNAVIHGPAPPRTGRRGRPRRQGDRLGTVSELASDGGFAEVDTAAGRLAVKRLVGQWYATFAAQPVQIVLAREPGSARLFDVALASTDLDAGAAELVARHRALPGGGRAGGAPTS